MFPSCCSMLLLAAVSVVLTHNGINVNKEECVDALCMSQWEEGFETPGVVNPWWEPLSPSSTRRQKMVVARAGDYAKDLKTHMSLIEHEYGGTVGRELSIV